MDAGGIVDLLSNPPVGYLTSTELVARVTAAYWFGQMAYFTLVSRHICKHQQHFAILYLELYDVKYFAVTLYSHLNLNS